MVNCIWSLCLCGCCGYWSYCGQCADFDERGYCSGCGRRGHYCCLPLKSVERARFHHRRRSRSCCPAHFPRIVVNVAVVFVVNLILVVVFVIVMFVISFVLVIIVVVVVQFADS